MPPGERTPNAPPPSRPRGSRSTSGEEGTGRGVFTWDLDLHGGVGGDVPELLPEGVGAPLFEGPGGPALVQGVAVGLLRGLAGADRPGSRGRPW